MGKERKLYAALLYSNAEAFPCFQTVSERPADCAVDPPVPCAQSCFLIRMWEHENMDDSTSKTSEGFLFFFVFFRSEELVLLSSGRVLWWNVAELKF